MALRALEQPTRLGKSDSLQRFQSQKTTTTRALPPIPSVGHDKVCRPTIEAINVALSLSGNNGFGRVLLKRLVLGLHERTAWDLGLGSRETMVVRRKGASVRRVDAYAWRRRIHTL